MRGANWDQRRAVRLTALVVISLIVGGYTFQAAGCKSRPADAAEEVKAFDVLKAYGENPAAADSRYKGKHFNIYTPGVTIRREDTGATIATHSPEYVKTHAEFRFTSEEDVAKLKKNTKYTIYGRCDGLDGNVVVFRECVAHEWTAPAK